MKPEWAINLLSFDWGFIYGAWHKDYCSGYIRFLGHGIELKKTTINKPLFSERLKIESGLIIGNYRVKYLKPISFPKYKE